jgi:hypothetical protein
MQSKTSYRIASPIIKENLRRFWPIALVELLILLMNGPFLFFFSRGGEDVNYVIDSNVASIGFFTGLAVCVFPVIAAAVLYKYLHQSGSVSVVHSLTYSRPTLFLSNLISGLMLILTPIIVTALTIIPFVSPSFRHLNESNRYGDRMLAGAPWNYNTDLGDLTRWFIALLIIAIFVYAISVFAGIITGTIAIHILVAILLNVVVPVFYLLTTAYFDRFLYGYTSEYGVDKSWALHPLLNKLVEDGPGMFAAIVYIFIAIIICAIALLLYRVLKLERATDVVTFKIAEYVIVSAVSFIGMSVVGFLFDLQVGNFFFYFGAFLGGIITFILVMMIARKSAKIFNRSTLKSFGCFVVVAVLFITLTTTNITGYETRIPSPQSVDSVEIDITGLSLYPYLYDEVINNTLMKVNLTNDESKEAVYALQKELIDDKEKYQYSNSDIYSANYMGDNEDYGEITFLYKLKNGRKIARRYGSLSVIDITNSASFERLFNSEECKKKLTLEYKLGNYVKIVRISSVNTFREYYKDKDGESNSAGYLSATYIDADEVQEFAKLLDTDFRGLDARDLRVGNGPLLTFEIGYSNALDEENFQYNITEKYRRSIAWLKEHGYYENMIATAENENG